MSFGYPDFNRLKRLPKQAAPTGKLIKLAILGDTATQFLGMALKGALSDLGFQPHLFEADIDQIGQQLEMPDSDLQKFQPDYTLIFEALPVTKKRFYKTESPADFSAKEIKRVQDYTLAAQRIGTQLLYLNHWEENDGVFGHFALQHPASLLFQLKQTNLSLMQWAAETPAFKLVDFNGLAAGLGYPQAVDRNIAVLTDAQIALELLPQLAYHITAIIATEQGQVKKCLILDLDNTLWGGIVGDDGWEKLQLGSLGIGKVFTELQQWALELKKRGIILAVASKNTESVAKEAFEKHPDMVLGLEDIAVFMANWDNKVMNIQKIQQILNIGFDSMVFLDDNPFERGMVRENLPQVSVPELPEDPAEYMPYLRGLNLFETANVSNTDKDRTIQYQTEAKRQEARNLYQDENTYLASLNMQAKVEGINDFNQPRIAQLTQRSNQFNLRTQRFSEAELQQWKTESDTATLAFSLSDKYGAHGLVAVLMLKQQKESMHIHNWLMSCRVLKRGLENFCLNQVVTYAKEKGVSTIVGTYLPTPKNKMVENHYTDLGFQPTEDDGWVLDVNSFEEKENFISIES
jgi:FkbH-like protein